MVTAQLICTFVFAYEKTSVSDDAAQLQIPHLRTVTTGKNSLTIKNGEEALPIMMDGKEDGIWVSELERSVFSCTPDRVFCIFTRFNKTYLLSLYKINILTHGSDKNRIKNHVLPNIGCNERHVTLSLSRATSQKPKK